MTRPTRCPLKRLTRAVRRWRRRRAVERDLAFMVEQGLVRRGDDGLWHLTHLGIAYGMSIGVYKP